MASAVRFKEADKKGELDTSMERVDTANIDFGMQQNLRQRVQNHTHRHNHHHQQQKCVPPILLLLTIRMYCLYIQIGTKADTFWCDGFNNYLNNIYFKFTFPFSLVSSNISSSRKLEYCDEEQHEWLQQWNFKKRSRKENLIHLWN